MTVYEELVVNGGVNLPQESKLDTKIRADLPKEVIHSILLKHGYEMVTNYYFTGKPFPAFIAYRISGERVEIHYKNDKPFLISFDRRRATD